MNILSVRNEFPLVRSMLMNVRMFSITLHKWYSKVIYRLKCLAIVDYMHCENI